MRCAQTASRPKACLINHNFTGQIWVGLCELKAALARCTRAAHNHRAGLIGARADNGVVDIDTAGAVVNKIRAVADINRAVAKHTRVGTNTNLQRLAIGNVGRASE